MCFNVKIVLLQHYVKNAKISYENAFLCVFFVHCKKTTF